MVVFHMPKNTLLRKKFIFIVCLFLLLFIYIGFFTGEAVSYQKSIEQAKIKKENKIVAPIVPPLDLQAYDLKIKELANNPKPKDIPLSEDQKSTDISTTSVVKADLWPVKTVYPKDGAILPFNRVVAYYGNLYSKKMGALGEYPKDEMFSRLGAEVKKWNEADPATPAIPALHYIATTAQLAGGEDGKYRLRMPSSEIDKVLKMAQEINALVFLDIQVGFSNLQSELPLLEKYFKLPNVHLGIDAEFSMKNGIRPGKVVGTFDALDINYAIDFLSKIVKDNELTPKILVVHRYTQKMITNYQNIKPTPEVQVVMHMDGWGGAAKKKNTYQQFVYKEPVQFTGFKLFYKNDILEKGTTIMTPEDLLNLTPRPIYIQYQ